ncbi:MAG: cation diffusion facilitator family transporter [Thermoguttaceae bacterium]|nr:cation diffusion facilitator family transporter [Thermoguttaceae bacterium]
MTSTENAKIINRVTWLGMIINAILTVLKFCAGIFAHSQVLVADAVHSLSDLSTDVAILVGVRFWEQPADEEHPHGHAKIETVVTVFIGVILFLVGTGLARMAITSIDELLDGKKLALPGQFAFYAAIVSIVSKEFLYQITARAGSRMGSTALIANAWHHRSDAISSIPAALAILGCMVFGEKYVYLDPVGTILVSGMIMYVAVKIVLPAFSTLLDAGVSKEKVETIRKLVLANPSIQGVHKIRTRSLGCGNIAVDLHIQVDPHMEVYEAHWLCHRIQEELHAQDEKFVDVAVHVEPLTK